MNLASNTAGDSERMLAPGECVVTDLCVELMMMGSDVSKVPPKHWLVIANFDGKAIGLVRSNPSESMGEALEACRSKLPMKWQAAHFRAFGASCCVDIVPEGEFVSVAHARLIRAELKRSENDQRRKV